MVKSKVKAMWPIKQMWSPLSERKNLYANHDKMSNKWQTGWYRCIIFQLNSIFSSTHAALRQCSLAALELNLPLKILLVVEWNVCIIWKRQHQHLKHFDPTQDRRLRWTMWWGSITVDGRYVNLHRCQLILQVDCWDRTALFYFKCWRKFALFFGVQSTFLLM